MAGVEHKAKAIEGLLDVEAGSSSDQACGTQRDELAAGTNSKGMIGRLQGSDINEALIEVELILVDAGARSAVATVDQATVELEKGAKPLGEVQVGARQVALEEVAIIGRLRAKSGVVLILAALAELPGDREEVVLSERDVVEAVGPVPLGRAACGGLGEIRPVNVPYLWRIGRRVPSLSGKPEAGGKCRQSNCQRDVKRRELSTIDLLNGLARGIHSGRGKM
jgi:hypothetical protein